MNRPPGLSPVIRGTLVDQVVKQMVSFIVAKGLQPGDRLPSERVMREQLGVGRSSMREAIIALSAVGAVEVRTGQGVFVGNGGTSVLAKPLSWALIMGEGTKAEVVEARQVLEVEMSGLAAERAAGEDLLSLETHLLAMEQNRHDLERYSLADLEFHLAIARASRNRVLGQMLETLRDIVRVWIYETYSERAFEEHLPVYEAIRAADRSQARQAMEHHMAGAKLRLFDYLAKADPPLPGAGSDAEGRGSWTPGEATLSTFLREGRRETERATEPQTG